MIRIPRGITDHPGVATVEPGEDSGVDYRYDVWLKDGWAFTNSRNAGCQGGHFNTVAEFNLNKPRARNIMAADGREVAERRQDPHPGGIDLMQTVDGTLLQGARWKTMVTTLRASAVKEGARIDVSIYITHPKRTDAMEAGLNLSTEDARALAWVIAPDVAPSWSTAPVEPGLYAVIEPNTGIGTSGNGIVRVKPASDGNGLVVGFRRVEHFNEGAMWCLLPPVPEPVPATTEIKG